MTKEQILKNHKYGITPPGADKRWATYLPDDSKPGKRRLIRKTRKEDRENEIVKYYRSEQRKRDCGMLTLEEGFEKWMLYRRDMTSVSKKTLQENKAEWNKFFKDTELSKMKLADIRPITIIRFFRGVTKDRKYSHKRVSNARTVLNGIMDYAIEEEIITHNPVTDVNFKRFTYKPVKSQIDNVFSEKDVEILLKYLDGITESYSLAIQLFFYLFARIGEITALKWKDVDWEKKSVYIHSQAISGRELKDDLSFGKKEKQVLDRIKGNTSKGFRHHPLSNRAIEILKRAKQLNPDGEYIFEPNGRLMSTDCFNRRLKKYCNEAGIKYHSSHKIRFYNASSACDGENIGRISRLMGHSNVATTMSYLRDVYKGDDSDIVDKLGLG